MVDLLVQNGTIVDGSGGPAYVSDIAVKNGKIETIGPSLKIENRKVLDASGKVVCPGFIDIHSHTDATILINTKAESKIRQGITTEIVGNCGMSAAPITTEFLQESKDHLTVNSDFGKADDIGKSWLSFGEYVQHLDGSSLGINLMPLVGYGTLRSSVMGLKSGPPTEKEMRTMEDLLAKSLEEGAAVLSSGLEYIPDSLCQTEELIQLAKVVKRYDKLYASHIRGESQPCFRRLRKPFAQGKSPDVRLRFPI